MFRRVYPRRVISTCSRGFTLIELVVILILVGILAVVAIPRFVGVGTYSTLGFYDRVASGIRFAQSQAIAKRRNVCVTFSAAAVSARFASAAGAAGVCDTNLVGPNGQNPYTLAPENTGITLAPVPSNFLFDALGRPCDSPGVPSAAQKIITISGDATRTLSVEPETGYVRTP